MLNLSIGCNFGGSGAAGFNPADLAPMDLWLDASQETGLVNGDPVPTLTDFSGNARNATQATAAKQPTYQTGVQNGRAVFRFDGIDDVLATPAFQAFPAKRGALFIVFKPTHASAQTIPIGTYASGGSAGSWMFYSPVTGSKWKWADGGVDQLSTNYDTPGAFQLQSVNRTADTTAEFKRNAVIENTWTVTDDQPTSKVLSVGKTTAFSSYYFQGDLALVLLYARALTIAETAKVENWINTRYSLY